MAYKLVFSKQAEKELSKFDRPISRLILSWLLKNINGCDNPRFIGKPLKGNLASYWRYRVGDYRVLCEINDGELVVLYVHVGNRKDIYDRL
jgi:mRNA interferase RelE/StbE